MSNNAQSEYVLVNVLEEEVRLLTRQMMQNMDMCKCEKCFLDACAITLNKIRAKSVYVTTTRGYALSSLPKLSIEHQTEMTVEVTKALMKVKAAPQH